jgi:hypothetical protein
MINNMFSYNFHLFKYINKRMISFIKKYMQINYHDKFVICKKHLNINIIIKIIHMRVSVF